MKESTQTKLSGLFQRPIQEVIDSIQTGVLITDETDTICWINESIYNHPIGRPEVKLLIGKTILQSVAFINEYLKKQREYKTTIQALIKERAPSFGVKVPLQGQPSFQLNYIPIFHKGQYKGAIWQYFPDAGEKQSSDEAMATASNLVDQLGFLYCGIDAAGNISRPSLLFSRFMCYPGTSLAGRNLFDFCQSGKEKLQDYISGNTPSGAVPKNRFDLKIKTLEGTKWLRCFPLYQAEESSSEEVELFMTDITSQKELQNELEQAREEAEKAQIAQQQFLASMSHDIRTPLNAIIGMTMLMEETSLTKQQKDNFKVLTNASNILLGLLNDILDFAKIETGQQEIHEKEFDLVKMIHALVDTFHFKLHDKSVTLNYDIDPGINTLLVGDTLILNQILMNLLTNAEKFTEEGAINIRAAIERTYENTVWIQFQVKDTGIGISKEDLSDIFRDFKRVGDMPTHYSGSGLGLFISKRLVALLGGDLQVESKLGKGSKFYFSLPFGTTSRPTEILNKDLSEENFSIKKEAKLLVVEDNPMNMTYISALLQKENISFDLEKDGKQAWKRARERHYDLILTDMKLPKMSGIELATSIRKEPTPNQNCPIILFSAVAFKESVDTARSAGIDDFLPKPFTPQQLLRLLHKYLRDERSSKNQKLPSHFHFNDQLDTAYLNHLYTGNIKYAKSLFQIFLNDIDADMEEIEKTLQLGQWEKLRELGHRIKPNFSMVGLTEISTAIQNVNDHIKSEEYHTAIQQLRELQGQLAAKLPIIKTEFRRMQDYSPAIPPDAADE